MNRSLSAIVLLVLLALVESSCRKKEIAVPVPSQPTPAPAPAVEAPQQQPAAGAPITTHPAIMPPATATPPTPTSPPKDEIRYQKNKAPEQPPPPKRAARPNPTPQQAPVPQGPTQNTTPPADSPRLGDILPPDQQRQYNTAIDQSLAHAQGSISSLTTRQLTKEQQATVAQVQSFMKQAQETRKADLAAAKSLAERAEVLAHDLAASLR